MSVRLSLNSVRLERGDAFVVDGVSLVASVGAFIGVVGPNGAGKTSLLRLAAGLIAPTEGAVRLDDQDPFAMRAGDRARRLAYLAQARPLYAAIDVEAVVALGRFAYGSASMLDVAGAGAVERAMAATQVLHLRKRTAPSLSGGELARVHLARALAAETPILIADEPVAALDPKHQLAIMRLLRAKAESGGLVLAALHEIGLARRFCTRIIGLKSGRVAADGPPDEALAEAGALFDLDDEDQTSLFAPA